MLTITKLINTLLFIGQLCPRCPVFTLVFSHTTHHINEYLNNECNNGLYAVLLQYVIFDILGFD